MKKLFLSILVLCIFTSISYAQDTHNTQFYTVPIVVNPAYTGFFSGNYRVGANYRNQWRSVTVPFHTITAYADGAFFKGSGRSANNNWLGAGIAAVGDKAGDGNLTTTKLQFSAAYHFQLFDNNLRISAGIGGQYIQKSFDPTALYFDSQWTGTDFNTTLPQNETFAETGINYTSLSSGINVSYGLDETLDIYASGAVHNMNQPEESFYNQANNKGIRMVYELGSNIYLYNVTIEPGIIGVFEKSTLDISAGSNFTLGLGGGYGANDVSKIILGGWLRYKDSFSPVIGAEFAATRLLISYDLNFSDLSPGSNGRGATEISVMHIGPINKRRRIGCPTF